MSLTETSERINQVIQEGLNSQEFDLMIDNLRSLLTNFWEEGLMDFDPKELEVEWSNEPCCESPECKGSIHFNPLTIRANEWFQKVFE